VCAIYILSRFKETFTFPMLNDVCKVISSVGWAWARKESPANKPCRDRPARLGPNDILSRVKPVKLGWVSNKIVLVNFM